jgi:hypothetical protein
MRPQQVADLLQLGGLHQAALQDKTVFHGPIVRPKPSRVQPQMNIF